MPTAYLPCGAPSIRCKARTIPGMPWCEVHAPKRLANMATGKRYVQEAGKDGIPRNRYVTDEEWEAIVAGFWERSAERVR